MLTPFIFTRLTRLDLLRLALDPFFRCKSSRLGLTAGARLVRLLGNCGPKTEASEASEAEDDF